MGQAKLRGTLEQRQAEARAKRESEERLHREELAAAEAAMTPEQRQRRARGQMALAAIFGMIGPEALAVARFARTVPHRPPPAKM
jgi:hypothetical protein